MPDPLVINSGVQI